MNELEMEDKVKTMRLTILTEPVGIYYNSRIGIKKMLGRDCGYGGHYAVTRSLIEGLKQIEDIDFNYRPHNEKEIYENVHVLAGVKTLQYALQLKKEGRIKHLTAGPNVVVFSTDADAIICDNQIEKYLQPSQWACDFHISMAPELIDRCVPWAAGIDLSNYDNWEHKPRNKVLIYHKDESEQFCYRLQYIVKKYGYEPVVIKYGKYKLDDYLNVLSQSLFMISLSRQESQGIFLTEAWAMNVPTICFDPHFYHWSHDKVDVEVEGNISTCPYLSETTGMRFETFAELESILESWQRLVNGFQPRKWVETNMTDVVCAKRFIDIVRNVYEK